MQLESSDIVQIVGILCSLITSITAIFISVLTLKQNSKMIEATTRPYIGVYLTSTYVKNVNAYLVVKNFGQSSATIKSFTYDFDFAECVGDQYLGHKPFENIESSTILPGESFRCVIDLNKIIEKTDYINFHVTYSFGQHQYEENICVNLVSDVGNFISHNNSPNRELEIISETLQDMHIHSL